MTGSSFHSFQLKTQWAVCTCHHFLWRSSAVCRWRGGKPFSKQTSKPSLCWCFVVLVVAQIHPVDRPKTVFHRGSKTHRAERNTNWFIQLIYFTICLLCYFDIIINQSYTLLLPFGTRIGPFIHLYTEKNKQRLRIHKIHINIEKLWNSQNTESIKNIIVI